CFEYRARALHDTVQRCCHPADYWMPNPALDVFDDLPSRALVPAPIEGFSCEPKLNDEIVGIIGRLRLAALLPPQPDESLFIIAHDNAGIRATEKSSATLRIHV